MEKVYWGIRGIWRIRGIMGIKRIREIWGMVYGG
jgi:hypothetical protein